VLEGAGIRRSIHLEAGTGRFLGLAVGAYRLRVDTEFGVAAWKDLVFRGPVLGELTIPVARPVWTRAAGGTTGGGRGGRGSR
jgi:hypothetical protein